MRDRKMPAAGERMWKQRWNKESGCFIFEMLFDGIMHYGRGTAGYLPVDRDRKS